MQKNRLGKLSVARLHTGSKRQSNVKGSKGALFPLHGATCSGKGAQKMLSYRGLLKTLNPSLCKVYRQIQFRVKQVLSVLSQWKSLVLLLKWNGCVYIIWEFRGKNYTILCNFPQRVEIEQKSTAHLGLGLLQPLMQKWRWIPSDQKALKCSTLTIFPLLGMENIMPVFLKYKLQSAGISFIIFKTFYCSDQ